MKILKLHKTKSEREFLHGKLLSCFFQLSIFFGIIILNPGTLPAQWRKLAQFSTGVNTIYFKEFTTSFPQDGFVSLTTGGLGKLWRTLDGGNTWTQITLPQINLGGEPSPSCFTFKNSTEGWFCDYNNNWLLKTIDGGSNWIQIPYTGNIFEIFYVPLTDHLIITADNIGGTSATIGVAFSDSIHGIISSGRTSATPRVLIYTNDAGVSWQLSTLPPEQYQPIGIKGTLTFYAISEYPMAASETGILARSDDGGKTWRYIYQYHNQTPGNSVTGTLQYNERGIFFQTVPDNSEGIMMSEDSGVTFHSICGPNNFLDTRFYVRDSFIYAGDNYGGLWLNTTGIGSNSTPHLSINTISTSALTKCQNFDSALTFTFFDSCNGIQAQLTSTSISGSNNFSFSSPSAIPRTIHPNDSLIISYNPQSSQPDTAQLHLRFHLGWKDFDTVVSLFGAGRIPRANVKFIPSSATYSANSGAEVDISYMPDKTILGRGLNKISFDLSYYGDLLNFIGPQNPNPLITVTTGTTTRNGSIETLPVTITGNNIPLDSLQAIAGLKFQAMITKTMQTPISMTNLKLNDGDPEYANCVLSADTSNSNFTLIAQCGDSTLSNFLNGIPPLRIISLRPNPAQDEIEIDLESKVKQSTLIEIFDALGVKVFSDSRNISVGSNSIHLDTKGLAAGMYLVRLGNVSQSFVKAQ